MRVIGRQTDEPRARAPLGHRRGLSDVTRFALDLPRAGADPECAARVRSYPSPPMSGSPPLPPKASQEAAERIQGTYQTATTAQDVYRGRLATQGEESAPTSTAPPRMSPSAGPERPSYGFQRHEGSMTRPLPYPQHQLAAINPQAQYQPAHRPVSSVPLPAPQSYPAPIQHQHQHQHPHQQHTQAHQQQPPPPQQHQQGPEPSRQASPKPQRKTKGHVASACVPCKRAHLRCDGMYHCVFFPPRPNPSRA
ncbi:hypothetical protein QBC39DRAFT_94718 [Podospora conica]|nr:hypothetical protein QBC39DRAFT_94718 [Schizothecium conicum]